MLVYNYLINNLLNGTQALIEMQGIAGTGKSSVINKVGENWFDNIAVMAFTGKASVNVDGETITSALLLPVPLPAKYVPLTPSQLSKLQRKYLGKNGLRKLLMIILDEKSLFGYKINGWVDKRLREIMCQLNKV